MNPSSTHYAFPSLGTTPFEQRLSWWTESPFKYDDLLRIVTLGDALPQAPTQVGGHAGEAPSRIRACEIRWVPMREDTYWIYDRVVEVVHGLNKTEYGFHLTGLQMLQYTTYRADPASAGHYDWHEDRMSRGDSPQRKLSIVIQLSEPDDYDGGELMTWAGAKPEVARKGMGATLGFPSFVKHRVTPVTRGVRKSLVCWAVGPQFV